jgi:glucosamine 6-phosphate synthetase-like amidotransferase/phosphosugar isomerase protein
MAFNAEAELKLLRVRVEGVERKLDTLEKTLRALPDLAALTKLATRVDAAEKALAGKKDIKNADQEAVKYASTLQALAKESVTKAVLENRLKLLETQVQTAMAMAGGKR